MKNKTNDQIILEQIIKDECAESQGEFTFSEFFELYTASEILKDYEVTFDDIKYGIVGSGGDGGIDSIFTFVNGEQLKEDTIINSNQKKNQIELIIIQSKTTPSFSESSIIKFRESAQDLFNLSNNPDNFEGRYNAELISNVKLFLGAYNTLAKTFPKMEVRYFYVTQANEVHPNVQGKVQKLKEDISKLFSGAEISFEFVGASKLLEMRRNTPSTSRALEVTESPIGTTAGSYLCLVSLSKYYEFISDSGSLARSIFESNVRDHQGNVVVNQGIKKTLRNPNSENFWYLNNGVTIITPKAVLAGKQLTIEDPQIVNGLQTSHEIYDHFSVLDNTEGDERAILIRVICEEDEEARDRIIRATNSQTSIPPASLRSSDEIHRNIEDYLKTNGYYYDRKKNHYKNLGMPIGKIISIPYLAQSMMAITLLRPDSARARPSTLINNDTEYEKIFSLGLPIEIYLKVILIMKEVENYLKPDVCGVVLERKEITNVKYYVATMISITLIGLEDKASLKLAQVSIEEIQEADYKWCLDFVTKHYNELGGTDQIAKGSVLISKLLEAMSPQSNI